MKIKETILLKLTFKKIGKWIVSRQNIKSLVLLFKWELLIQVGQIQKDN